MHAALVALAALLASTVASHAAEARWGAASRTATAITGDITVFDHRITFGNGASMSLEPVGPDRPFVFRPVSPSNPVLMNGNRLCGSQSPTFIVLARDGNSLYMKVFDGPEAPVAVVNPLPQPGVCATFNFELIDESAGGLSDRDAIRQAQEGLNALGYDAGPVDGVMGRRTRQALASFQSSRGLPRTARADPQTLAVLADARSSAGPSFDCGKAGTEVERAICGSPSLGRLDAELAETFQARRDGLSVSGAERELQRQRAWLERRNSCGGDVSCLEASYSERLAALDAPGGGGTMAAEQAAAVPTAATMAVLGAEYPILPAALSNDIPAEWEDVRPYVPEWLLARPTEEMDDDARIRLLEEIEASIRAQREAALQEAADRHLARFLESEPDRNREYFELLVAELCIANDSGGYLSRSTLALCQEHLAVMFLNEIIRAANGQDTSRMITDPAAR